MRTPPTIETDGVAAPPLPRRDRIGLRLGAAGVVAYVATWFAVGLLTDGYDPLRQAISETFDAGAPRAGAAAMVAVLVATGVLLVVLGPALDRSLPGTGRVGAWLTVLSGVGSAAVALFPCTDGCPGFGTTTTDSLHVVTAGLGYLGLVTAPIAFGVRLRPTSLRWLSTAGFVLGGLATLGFLTRNLGPELLPGLQQRVFNTLADLWYVLAAGAALRHGLVTSAGSSDS